MNILFVRSEMSGLYCPFCSTRYQFHKTRDDGVLICGHCGDALVKKNGQNSRRIIGALVALAYFTPLFIMIFFVVRDFTNERLPNNSQSIVLLTIDDYG